MKNAIKNKREIISLNRVRYKFYELMHVDQRWFDIAFSVARKIKLFIAAIV